MEDPGSLVWWTGIQLFLGEEPQASQACPYSCSSPLTPCPCSSSQTRLPALQVCFIIDTYTNLFNSWILFYMSHIFYFTVPWQHCPVQRNSSSFGEEGEVEKRRALGRGENRKEGHELEDNTKSRGLQG